MRPEQAIEPREMNRKVDVDRSPFDDMVPVV